MISPEDLAAERWDAIVVGTGIGGGTAGYALARAGMRVLFVERGLDPAAQADAIRGTYPDLARAETAGAEVRETLRRGGRLADPVEDRSGARPRRFVPILGSGVGGSSALYGMAMERFSPADFAPRAHFPAGDGDALPERWPIAYDELAPFYDAAERLYRVRGERDPRPSATTVPPLPAAPALSPAAQEIADSLRRRGLHPYRLPLACEFAGGCGNCQGFLCALPCKVDSARAGVRPAVAAFGATLLADCEALRLEAGHGAVAAVVCRCRGREVRFAADLVILAAGALETPALLLRSASDAWPQGLANRSGLVGRCLMRHFTDLYVVRTRTEPGPARSLKEIGSNDLYLADGGKFGTLQSFGQLPPPALMVRSLAEDVAGGSFAWAAPLVRLAAPLLRRAIGRRFDGVALAAIAEDRPYAGNRVEPLPAASGARVALTYRIAAAERGRIGRFRELVGAALQGQRFVRLNLAENNRMLGHACGTCRFGLDPAQSVLDADNRAHGLANLYVVDSSFFPSSGGTNPSLTIAANALRVAARITHAPVAAWRFD